MYHQWIFHNSHEIFFRSPFGAVACEEKISLSLEINCRDFVEAVFLRLWKYDKEEEVISMSLTENQGDRKTYKVQISAPSRPSLLWYYFIVNKDGRTYYYGNNSRNLGGVGQIYNYAPPSYQVTVYKQGTSTPNWFKETIMYQIFVERFCNGNGDGEIENLKENSFVYTDWWEDIPVYRRDPATGRILSFDFFGGNLLGVLKKLPYLKELGISVIYFNPIFEALSNHKYDTGDYHQVDPMFGDNQLFQKLCKKAEAMGISIILDGVFSHTGSDSIYFNREGNYPSLGAYQSKDSVYYPWYRFEQYPNQYECWWGVDSLPNVNEMEPSYQDFIINSENSVIRYWMKLGAKGWRLDVADELPDQFIKNLRQVMKEINQESILIGEIWEDASNKISYHQFREYLLGEELDSTMNYPLRNIFLEFMLGRKAAWETHLALMNLYENYPLDHFYSAMNLIGSHDVPRVLTLLGDAPPEHSLSKEEQGNFYLSQEQRSLAIARLKLLALIQMTFPGVPHIYYGDEVGLEGYADPLNRRTYPWGREDQELLNWYKQIIALRNNCDALKTGEWIPVYAQGDVYGYIRRIKQGRDLFGQNRENGLFLLLFNRNIKEEVTVLLDLKQWEKESFVDLLEGKQEAELVNGKLNILLRPLEGKVLAAKGGENGA